MTGRRDGKTSGVWRGAGIRVVLLALVATPHLDFPQEPNTIHTSASPVREDATWKHRSQNNHKNRHDRENHNNQRQRPHQPPQPVDKTPHRTRVLQLFSLHCAHSQWHAPILLSAPLCVFVQLAFERKFTHSSFNRAIAKSLVPLLQCATARRHFFSLAHLRFAYRHRSLICRVKRCSTLLVSKLPTTLNIKIDLRMRG